jgi:hypothetical protein
MDSAESSLDIAEMRLKRGLQLAVTDDGIVSLRSGFVFATVQLVMHGACQPKEILEIALFPKNFENRVAREVQSLEQIVPTMISGVSPLIQK